MSVWGRSGGRRGSSTRSQLLWRDQRAQSIVVGAILMFSLLVLVLGVIQTTIIPSENADIEAQHSQQVRGEMQDLRNDIRQAAATGQDASQAIKVGIDYPPRAFFLNPGPSSGLLQTMGTDDDAVEINISNAEALNAETFDYWNGTSRNFSTGAVSYSSRYNVYQNPPNEVVVENSLVYSTFDDETLLASDQRIVDGRDISLVAIDGRIQTSQVQQFNADTSAVSPATRTVTVRDTGEPVEINITTRLSEEKLVQDVFQDQMDGTGNICDDFSTGSDLSKSQYITNCKFTPGPGEFNTFTMILEQGATYDLKLAKVGVGHSVSYDGAHYITKVRGDEGSLVDVERREFVVEVRDRFNNPVSGEEVPLEATNGDFAESGDSTLTATTNEEGRISVTYIPGDVADGGSRDDTIRAGGSLDFDGDGSPDFDPDGSGDIQDREEVTFDFTVVDSEADTDVGASVNPAGPIILTNSETSGTQSGGTGGGGGSVKCEDGDSECYATFTLDHNNPGGDDWTITELRYHFYIAPGAPGTGTRESPPGSVDLTDMSSCSSETYVFQDNYDDASTFGTITQGSSKTFRADFDQSDGTNFDTIQGDGFFVTIKFESAADPNNKFSATYFASPNENTGRDYSCSPGGG